ncbi:DJ-1/PfpI family protein [Nitrospirillum sp. BR 11164]|uniref:DJ-1/PfpI family protein n=1 Tax=Nitrospirillum sp. BR 11164 TaxID=3104324 RepID=UPI002AFF7458|nr:DJ-1/PfpI family protein [Nitrospirillum sp. BR 11164]MEA1649905.1 DJ-1/PfpI family protein [Nitrospirillum sp. BR 11164]
MTDQPLAGKAVAILIANGFEEVEMTEAQRALLRAGAAPKIISPEQGLVNGWHGTSWGHYFPTDKQIGEVLAADFDLLVLPGGERSVAKLAANPHTRRIIGSFMDAGKGVAAINHGVQLLAVAQRLKGRTVTGNEAIRETVEAAGATWVAEEGQNMNIDRQLLTARGPEEVVPEFIETMLRVFADALEYRRQLQAEKAAAA